MAMEDSLAAELAVTAVVEAAGVVRAAVKTVAASMAETLAEPSAGGAATVAGANPAERVATVVMADSQVERAAAILPASEAVEGRIDSIKAFPCIKSLRKTRRRCQKRHLRPPVEWLKRHFGNVWMRSR